MPTDFKRRLTAFVLLASLASGAMLIASCRSQPLKTRDAAGMEDPPMYFPTITAENLNKEKVTLPDDLAGNPALVLVAFKRQQQSNIDTWLEAMESIEQTIPGVRIIETPTISALYWGWMAGFIDNGMRSGIPDEQARGRTITLYTDVKAFRKALELETNDTVYAVLLDEQGRVMKIEQGDFSDEKLDALSRAAGSRPMP